MKKSLMIVIILLLTVFLGLAREGLKKDFADWMKKGDQLFSEKKYQECLNLLDSIEGDFPNRKEVFAKFRFNVYKKMGDYQTAVKYGEIWDKLRSKRSPNGALNLAQIYLGLKNYDQALNWLKKSAERGFQNYYIFDKYNYYDPLKKDPRFHDAVNLMKEKIGLGKSAREFTTTHLDGTALQLETFRGKVVLIDFWATWCPPCIKAFPRLKKLYQTFKDKGFEIIGISADDARDKVESFLAKSPLPWKIAFSGKGWEDPVMRLYGVQNIPSVWLVDKRGVLRYFQVEDEKLEGLIAKLIEER